MRDDVFDLAISSLYDAALVEGGWDEALVHVARAVGDRRLAVLQVVDHAARRHDQMAATGYDINACFEQFADENEWMAYDVWRHAVPDDEMPPVVIASEYVDPQAYASTLMHNEMLRPAGVDGLDLNAAIIDVKGGVVGMLGVYADAARPVFEPAEKANMARLQPHIVRAAAAGARLAEVSERMAVSTTLLDRLTYGVAFIDTQGRLSQINAPAERMLTKGEVLASRQGRLQACATWEERELAFAIERALGKTPSGLIGASGAASVMKLYGQTRSRPWTISISPVQSVDRLDWRFFQTSSVRAIACFSDHAPITELRAAQIAATHGLTAKEAEIAGRLAAGDTIACIAEDTGRSVQTLRSQLKSIFFKTEVTTQAELVRLVLSAPLAP